MPSPTRIFPYKIRIENSVIIQQNTGQKKLVFCHILCCVTQKNLFTQYTNLQRQFYPHILHSPTVLLKNFEKILHRRRQTSFCITAHLLQQL